MGEIMKRAIVLLVLLASIPSVALGQQTGGAAKLIIFRPGGGIAVADYPTAARCEAARKALIALVDRENALRKPTPVTGGGVIIPNRLSAEAYCIPG